MYQQYILLLTILLIGQAKLEDESHFDKVQNEVLIVCGNDVSQLLNDMHLRVSAQVCQQKLSVWLKYIDRKLLEFNVKAADLDWKLSFGGTDISDIGPILAETRSKWRRDICNHVEKINIELINQNQNRQLYFLCRGIDLTPRESEIVSNVLSEMQTIYTTSKVCFPLVRNITLQATGDIEDAVSTYLIATRAIYLPTHYASLDTQTNYMQNKSAEHMLSNDIINLASKMSTEYHPTQGQLNELCMSGEPDLERLMSKSKREDVLRWAWLAWREKVGPPIKPFYNKMVSIKNTAAQRNGYPDLGALWREELETPNLEILMDKLFDDIHELYVALHGVARYFLRRFHGPAIVPERGAIPAHILGNMWAQSWDSILEIIMPQARYMNLNEKIKNTGWTTHDMIRKAEDFYMSMGLPAMTEKFWKYSYFGENVESNSSKSDAKCHGTAANMFLPDDYRMIYCAGNTMEDFYVIHHEMGHIQYYMAYDKYLPVIFRDGANSAFHESVGDSVMFGVLTPQHLQRLGLINKVNSIYLYDSYDKYKKDLDVLLLMRQALSKIPQIPYAYIIDKYRWAIFSGKIKVENYNEAFWDYIKKYQGLEPPNNQHRSEKYFDAAAKFHIPDNTPYVRYFLSSFLSPQIYCAMCQWSIFDEASPDLILPMPLHQCDIYGSKKAGSKLHEMMSRGSSLHWSQVLYDLTGEKEITSSAILQYFAPLKKYLFDLIQKHDIPLGW